MRFAFAALPALLAAGAVFAQGERQPDPRDPRVKAPPVEYRSAFEDYRRFAEPEQRDWRKSNEEVGSSGGHAGHKPGQGPSAPSSKPQPGSPEASGHGGHK